MFCTEAAELLALLHEIKRCHLRYDVIINAKRASYFKGTLNLGVQFSCQNGLRFSNFADVLLARTMFWQEGIWCVNLLYPYVQKNQSNRSRALRSYDVINHEITIFCQKWQIFPGKCSECRNLLLIKKEIVSNSNMVKQFYKFQLHSMHMYILFFFKMVT